MKANGYKTRAWVKGRKMGAVERALRLANYDVTVPSASDHFFEAVVGAIKAFNGAKMRAACSDGGPTEKLILHLLSNRPLGHGDRRSLANLLAGELNSAGRPRVKAAELRAYAELLTEAKRKRRDLSGADKNHKAAKWAAQDPRAGGRRASTIERDMGRKSTHWGL